ncbi:MAG TPA: hypothetical protein VEA58_04450 [Anaerovoracaceae bacterium]|nr:hypothetical protein [Anaerovoracaceae bacterium]
MITKHDFNPQCITYSQMNMIFNARIYYRRLTTWTIAYIISRYTGVGTSEELFGRLYLESIDIGNMMQIIFGRDVSDRYSQMVSQFPIAFRDLLSAQLEGDTESINQYVDQLYRNVGERAAFLEAINPYWTESGYRDLFGTYIQYTIEIANAFASGDYSKYIETYDRLTEHTNKMGDTFAQGLYDYITSGQQTTDYLPLQESDQCITIDQMNTIFNIRMFWFELATWTRSYMLSRYRGLGNTEAVFARLKQVPVDYTNTIKQIFGEEVAAGLLQELNTYLELLDEFITAQLEGDIDEIDRITKLLYENADKRAALISSVNPFWTFEEWRNRLYNNLRDTLNQSTTFLMGDYARNIDIYSRILDLAENTSSYFAQGLFQYFNSIDPKPESQEGIS